MKNFVNKFHLDFILLLLIFIAASALILPLPFTRDQGIYSYVAWRWINDAIPYRDTWEHKGPLLYAVYAFFLPLSKGAMWGVNLADLLARTGTVIATYIATLIVNDRRTARVAAFFTALPLAAVFTSCWWNAQAETFMMPLLVLSVGLAATSRSVTASRLCSGMLVAQAIMLKSTAFIHAFFLIVYLLMKPRRSAEAPRWDAAWFSAGLIAGLLPWLLYFVLNNAFPDMWDAQVVFNTFHAGFQTGFGFKQTVLHGLAGIWVVSNLLLIPAAIPLIRWAAGRRDPGIGIGIGFLASALAQVIVQEKFFLYHWLVIIPAVGLVASQGFVRSLSWFRGEGEGYRYVRMGLPAIMVAIVIAELFIAARFYLGIQIHYETVPYLLGQVTTEEYYSRFSEEDAKGRGDFNFLASYTVAQYIRNHTRPEDRVLVFGYEPIINYLSGRPSPSRFHSDYPLTFQAKGRRAADFQRRARWIFMNDINKTPPAIIVLVANDKSAIEPEDSMTQARAFTEFADFLDENYELETVSHDFYLYRLKD